VNPSLGARVRHPCRTRSGKALPNPDLQLQIRPTSLFFFSSFHNSFRTLKVSFKGGTEGGLSGPCAVGNGVRTPMDDIQGCMSVALGRMPVATGFTVSPERPPSVASAPYIQTMHPYKIKPKKRRSNERLFKSNHLRPTIQDQA